MMQSTELNKISAEMSDTMLELKDIINGEIHRDCGYNLYSSLMDIFYSLDDNIELLKGNDVTENEKDIRCVKN